MSICFKCNKSIKPASLATTVSGEKYHPTCISCRICERPLWGKPFKKNKDGSLSCEQPCQPLSETKPIQTLSQPNRPSSAQRQQQLILEQTVSNFDTTKTNLDMYKKPLLDTKLTSNSDSGDKKCQSCNQFLNNKRFITYENGVKICQECEDNLKKPLIPRIISANSMTCSFCNQIVKGTKFVTEKNGDIICDNCDKNGPKCEKCKLLLKPNELIRRLNFDVKFHDECFECKNCKTHISSEEFFSDDIKKNPICQNCFELSKLPKCSVCLQALIGSHLIVENKPMHETCFKCFNCKDILSKEKGYFKDKTNEQAICAKCNLILNGINCAKCSQVIEKDGISFSEKDFHQTCFKCDSCATDLTKMKKTLTDKDSNSLFCEPCFIQKYAPKCNKCNEPITPYLPGTIYEDKNYHKECFACARCKRTLANKKFFKSGNILICENCY
ncbi:unnamed protein product [Brachionus calyciflorus]|uniref:LIM zinc-binding domain-containing protein n=1 Tax=Brachionus calyciflorus TaxID=104777 RepID=A0A813VQ27_9BILA|nr:unnamed protein product [Brachionus calyciflorus]